MRWAVGVSLCVVALTFLPYLFDWSLQGASNLYGWYSWSAFNVTDHCVYLSWMRQYADGAWFHRNLFTTAAQAGHQFNLLFLVLGKLGGWTGIPLAGLYHVARAAASLACLLLIWRLIRMALSDRRARRTAFLVVSFSAGLGWAPGLWERGFAGPVDVWQPEAVTFLSLYLFPLFAASLALMLAILINLWEAESRKSFKHAAWAGLCALILGNIHTYDIITVSVVWVCFLAVAWAVSLRDARPERWRPDRGTLVRLAVAGIPAALSSGYMYWVLKTEAVFAQRVAVPTLTPSPLWVLLGFGLLAPAAVYGAVIMLRRRADITHGALYAGLLIVVWAAANLGVAYLPFSFQRKLLMGAHIPVALPAGVAFHTMMRGLNGRRWTAAMALVVIVLALTNIRFMLRDRGGLRHGGETVRAFMLTGERTAVEWLRQNAAPGAVIQPLPWIAQSADGRMGFVDTTVACFVPGLTGRPVDAGHWGETPDFGRAMGRWLRFMLPDTPDQWRRELLRNSGASYVIFSQKRAETLDEAVAPIVRASPVVSGASYLRRIEEASNEDADVFEVVNP